MTCRGGRPDQGTAAAVPGHRCSIRTCPPARPACSPRRACSPPRARWHAASSARSATSRNRPAPARSDAPAPPGCRPTSSARPPAAPPRSSRFFPLVSEGGREILLLGLQRRHILLPGRSRRLLELLHPRREIPQRFRQRFHLLILPNHPSRQGIRHPPTSNPAVPHTPTPRAQRHHLPSHDPTSPVPLVTRRARQRADSALPEELFVQFDRPRAGPR
ncbi:hypothetical protein NS506_07737 [Nocardia seriolae]|uniref:Uncharacterized protein n=1 Tax=Nocardia seriolae TaxID=37332 RepID=A0ABC8B605_9NOCA|nr:hypothetical protein NS506_07737 [Nocardia seriolae]